MNKDKKASKNSVFKEIWHFFLHLRWHYQLFILSGGYILGGFYSDAIQWDIYLFQFVNVHLFLFGGATAYNSFWDKDEGPIGGLKNPPSMSRWMWFASILIQCVGLLLAIPAGELFVSIYATSLILFWLYSSPITRWKARPIKSMVAIGISTGTNSMLLGYLAAGSSQFNAGVILCSLGVAFVILSLYPISQIFQIEEDNIRGDQTFALTFGVRNVFRFFIICYLLGSITISIALTVKHLWFGLGFLLLSLISAIWIWNLLQRLSIDRGDYDTVMQIKYGTSFSFVLFLVVSIILKHTFLGVGIF